MKSLNSSISLLIAAALLTTFTACKHGPKAVTPIMRGTPTQVGESGGNPNLATLPNANKTGAGGNVGPGGTANDPNATGTNPLGTDPNRTTSNPLANQNPDAIKNPGERPDLANTDRDDKVLAAETVFFDYDKATVKQSEVAKVQRVAAYLKNEANVQLLVEGNCDERGTEEYNRSLGERRALAVRELLVTAGVSPERVTTLSYGEDKPADAGHDEAAWAKNRRGDFVVLRPKTIQ